MKINNNHGIPLCPSCSRPTGPALECPYCGTETHRRRHALRLRWTAVLLVAAGFGILVFL